MQLEMMADLQVVGRSLIDIMIPTFGGPFQLICEGVRTEFRMKASSVLWILQRASC
jgi:hypothetical protein